MKVKVLTNSPYFVYYHAQATNKENNDTRILKQIGKEKYDTFLNQKNVTSYVRTKDNAMNRWGYTTPSSTPVAPTNSVDQSDVVNALKTLRDVLEKTDDDISPPPPDEEEDIPPTPPDEKTGDDFASNRKLIAELSNSKTLVKTIDTLLQNYSQKTTTPTEPVVLNIAEVKKRTAELQAKIQQKQADIAARVELTQAQIELNVVERQRSGGRRQSQERRRRKESRKRADRQNGGAEGPKGKARRPQESRGRSRRRRGQSPARTRGSRSPAAESEQRRIHGAVCQEGTGPANR